MVKLNQDVTNKNQHDPDDIFSKTLSSWNQVAFVLLPITIFWISNVCLPITNLEDNLNFNL